MAKYEAAGHSLNSAAFLPGSGPAEENFEATPLLDGIRHPDDGSPARKKGGGHRGQHQSPAAATYLTRSDAADEKRKAFQEPAVTKMSSPTGLRTDGARVRAFPDPLTPCKPPPDELSDPQGSIL